MINSFHINITGSIHAVIQIGDNSLTTQLFACRQSIMQQPPAKSLHFMRNFQLPQTPQRNLNPFVYISHLLTLHKFCVARLNQKNPASNGQITRSGLFITGLTSIRNCSNAVSSVTDS